MTKTEIKIARINMGLDQKGFAEFLGMTSKNCQRTISRWENGKTPIPGWVDKILNKGKEDA